jgi:two-component system sensor histidine kinase CpxA
VPRMFWKLFFALWLSIMAFAVVVSWINETVMLRNEIETSRDGFQVNLNRFKERLARDLKEGGEPRVIKTLQNLPRGMRNHIYVLNPQGRELLDRDRAMKQQKKGRVRFKTKKIHDASGQVYTLLSAGRPPPRALLEPGPRGVGMRLGVAAIVSALVSFLLARYLAAPLGRLSKASRKLATGDLTARVGAPLDQRNDEFGQLALDMDEMAARLQAAQLANQRLLRDVSHELRSPLARLRVALEIARNKDQAQVVDELNRIELESERLEALVDEVLGLLRESSGSQELKMQGFDLAELLQDLVEAVSYEAGDVDNSIEMTMQPPLMIEADRELLWRVFENLLRNALIHSGKADGIHVSAKLTPGNEVQVSVRDSGPGIDEAHIKQIFEPFYRVDEARNRKSGGHGLGLAIAASAVRRHGGRISASNLPGGGLQVQVVLPTRQGQGSGI